METAIPGDIESEKEERALGFEDLGELEKHGIFARHDNSIVGNLGAERILKALSFGRSLD